MIPHGYQLYKPTREIFELYAARSIKEAKEVRRDYLGNSIDLIPAAVEQILPMSRIKFRYGVAIFDIVEYDNDWVYTHSNIKINNYKDVDPSLLSSRLYETVTFNHFSFKPDLLPDAFNGIRIAISKHPEHTYLRRKYRIHFETPEDYMKVKLSI